MSEALVPLEGSPAVMGPAIALPRLIVEAGPAAAEHFLEFFAAQIANDQTRATYARAAGQFLACARRAGSASVPSRRSTWPPTSGPIRARCRR